MSYLKEQMIEQMKSLHDQLTIDMFQNNSNHQYIDYFTNKLSKKYPKLNKKDIYLEFVKAKIETNSFDEDIAQSAYLILDKITNIQEEYLKKEFGSCDEKDLLKLINSNFSLSYNI